MSFIPNSCICRICTRTHCLLRDKFVWRQLSFPLSLHITCTFLNSWYINIFELHNISHKITLPRRLKHSSNYSKHGTLTNSIHATIHFRGHVTTWRDTFTLHSHNPLHIWLPLYHTYPFHGKPRQFPKCDRKCSVLSFTLPLSIH